MLGPDKFHQPMNFFREIEQGILGARSRNEHASAASLQRAFDALMRCQGQPVPAGQRV